PRNRPESVSATKIHPYAAFPLQPTREDLDQVPPPSTKEISKEGIEFTLTITFPNAYADDVKTALWAWETFGGLGARTRRGFGALQLLAIDDQAPTADNLPPSFEQAQQWLAEKLAKLPAKDHGFPYIGPNLRFKVIKTAHALNGWYALIEKLQQFRQGKDA